MVSGQKLRGDFVLFFGGASKVAFTKLTSVAVAKFQQQNFLFEESTEKQVEGREMQTQGNKKWKSTQK